MRPREEALIFTPPGFDKPGEPAEADEQDAAQLHVTIHDAATGKPTFCRVNVVGADGNYYQPRDNPLRPYSFTGTWPERLAGNRQGKEPIRYFGHFFYTDGTFDVRVPAGPVRIEVWKGFEYRPVSSEIQAEAGVPRDVALTITRTAAMDRHGWYGGDSHLHFIRTGEKDEETIFDLLEAEDIRFGTVLCYNEDTSAYRGMMPEQGTPQRRGLGARSIRCRGAYQIISGQEYRNGVLGHLNLFLRDEIVLPGRELDPNVGPMFGTIGAETQADGGFAVHAHGGYALEIWADLVKGSTNGVELMQFGIYRGIGLEGWYHALGAGFRFPGYGASDYPACRKLGDCRTYVQIDGEPTFEKWHRAAAVGRSFMTSGPLLLLEVDGNSPGETITTEDERPRTVQAHLRVLSEVAPVTDVQLIVNGRVVETMHAEAERGASQRLEWSVPVTVKESSWIAARAFSKSPLGSADADAHTNPVYVHLDGKRPFAEEDARWLMARLDDQIADHRAREVAEKETAIAYFERSKQILGDLIDRGGHPADDSARPANADKKQQATTTTDRPEPAASPAEGGKSSSPEGPSLAEFLKPVPAKEPADAQALFETQHGFRMELVAAEPDVTDPVAACFDADGGMYVAEMIDYPYRPKDGATPLGRVRYLQDTDDDGRYDRSWIFADGLVWPTGVVCWKGGVYVAAAPDIWYLKDEDGDHRADVRTRVFTGFGDRNQQGGVNNLNWHVDHRIYGSASTNGGTVRPADDAGAAPIVLSDRDFRFDPVTHAFETVSGSRQFGNAFDDWFNRFLCSESKPAYHVVLSQRYVARNPHLAVPTAVQDLAPGVTPIFRTSPIERWRQVRSSRRLAVGERGADAAGLSHNVIDAAGGLAIYRGHAYPAEYRGNLLIGCSQNNLIHRRTLSPDGATFRSQRADTETEFVRTTDTWFRPVNCVHAPDGTLYVLDMSREVIESIHIAHDVVAHLDLTSGRDRGRIYRLAPPGFEPPPQPRLSTASTAKLVEYLEHPGGWWRDTASRLIHERQDHSVVELLRRRLVESPTDTGRLHVLWALEGLAALESDDLAAALADASPGVREHAVRLAESRIASQPALARAVLKLADDPALRVRFQVAFTLGELDDPRAVDAMARIVRRDAADLWVRTAVLSSCARRADRLAVALLSDDPFLATPQSDVWISELATIVGAGQRPAELARLLDAAAALPDGSTQRATVVRGIGAGLRRGGGSLAELPSVSEAARDMVARLIARASDTARDTSAPASARTGAIQMLSYSGGPNVVETLTDLVSPEESPAVQQAALRVVARHSNPAIAGRLIEVCRACSPDMQAEILTVLGSRPSWSAALLEACQRGEIPVGLIPQTTQAALLQSDDTKLRETAETLFGATRPRAEVIERYRAATTQHGDARRGDKVYQRECMACHQIAGRGKEVGPNLALIRNRTRQALVESILDPNRNVAPNYVSYVLVDDSGRTLTGLIVSETATSITLARDKGEIETIQKQNIEQIKSTGKSLMPEGLEKTIDPRSMADLLAFLETVQYDIGTLPDFPAPD